MTPWQSALVTLAGANILLMTLFRADAAAMVDIWWNSSTFNHCLLIVPILVWLVAQRKEQLAQLQPQPWAPGLVYVAGAGLCWLLGDAAGLAVARQLGLILMVQGTVITLLGPNVARGLLFPLFYMFFLLPIGEEAVPALQTLTADMCMALLNGVGIPANLDGIFITTPTGYFRVAEACSGVKFLIAMVAYGVLVSDLCFESWTRRAIFLLACVVVPILANGVRAFATIYIAHYQGIAFAESFDHVVYGWVFFGIVIALLMAAGWPFFDKTADAEAFDPSTLQTHVSFKLALPHAIAALLLIIMLPFAWSSYVSGRSSPVPATIALPVVQGWEVVPSAPGVRWTPRFDGATHFVNGRYRNVAGQEVDIFVAVYDRQTEGRELVGFGQGAVDPDGIWSWSANLPAPPYGKAERIKTKGVTRDVVSFYRINGVTTGSASTAKLATLRAKLLSENQQAVAILVSGEHVGDRPARPAIDAFTNALGNIDNLGDQFAGLR